MIISPVCNNVMSPSFSGMTKKLKNRIYLDGQKDIDELIKQNPNVKPVVGQLPKYIFDKLPVENRKEAIQEIMDAFDKVALEIRSFKVPPTFFSMDMSKMHRPESVNKILTDVFRKYNITQNEINVKYIDQGGKGKVFKIDGLKDPYSEDEYVIKVFHTIKGENWHPYKSHGCYAEINNGIYWRNHEGFDTHRGKFFFASLGSGYMVSKFIDEDTRFPQRIVDEYKYGIKCTDEEKSGPVNGYNRLKGYNYDYGGMRVVNRIKNSDKIARKTLEKIRNLPQDKRSLFWYSEFDDKSNQDSKVAGLALGIKYLDKKNHFIDKCLNLNMPKVNQALAYVLKYLPHEDAVKYFEKLVNTNDEITQIILFNEIPLLAKRKDDSTEIKDDIHASLKEIIPERIYTYYMLAEKYALPSTVEHLASFVHLLPKDKVKQQYIKLSNIDNPALQERLLWKIHLLTSEMQEYAILKLSKKVSDPYLQKQLANFTEQFYMKKIDSIKADIYTNKS